MGIARVALPVAVPHAFDYWIPEGLDVRRGSVVRVRLANRSSVGVVVGIDFASEVRGSACSRSTRSSTIPPIADEILDLAEFVGRYYQAAPGLALELAVPPSSKARSRRSAGAGIADVPPIARPRMR